MSTSRKPTTDAEISAYTVGKLEAHDDTIFLADYDPSWPAMFAREAERIRRALGDTAVQLEHVGSTSVPGLAAKPRIDIVLVVPDSSDEPSYAPALESAGYVLRIREPDSDEHRVFKGPDTDVNLHVYSRGCIEIERMVRFRDWLRTHAGDRALYEQTKRRLAARRWRYVQNYADAKTEVVEHILARAMGDAGLCAPLSPDDAAFISARIAAFASEAPPEWRWQLPYIERFGALPIYPGWTETLALAPDGSLVRWSTESECDGVRPIENERDARLVLVQCARRYPELQHLLPRRPPHATTCAGCGGTGSPVPSNPDIICECGGLGWTTPEAEAE